MTTRKPPEGGRPTIRDEVADMPKTIKFTASMMNALRERSAQSGATISEEVRRAVERDLAPKAMGGELEGERVVFFKTLGNYDKMQELAHALRQPDAAHLAKVLLDVALENPDVARRFLYNTEELAKPKVLATIPTAAEKEAANKEAARNHARALVSANTAQEEAAKKGRKKGNGD